MGVLQTIIATAGSTGGGGTPPTPQPNNLYAWEWDSDNFATQWADSPYATTGSTFPTGAETVNLTASGGWNTTGTTWFNGNPGIQAWGASSSSYLQTPDWINSTGYGSSWASSNRTGLTIEMWFYPTNGARTLVGEWGGGGGAGYSGWHDTIVELNSNGTIVANIWPYSGANLTTGNSVNFNAWNHVIYTYNISTTTLSIQLNGGPVASASGRTWQCAVEYGGGLHYAFGYADAVTDLSADANATNFDGRWGKIRIANFPMDSHYNSDWTKYNPFNVVDSLTSLGTSWSVEVVGEFFPSQYWATIWGNEVWNSSTGHLAYFTGSTNLVVGRPNAQFEYTLTQPISTRAYWVFAHTDGGGIDVYRNGVLLTPSANNYTQPSVAGNTLIFGSRHGNDGTGTTDFCPGNYLYTNISASALPPATIATNYTMLQGTYGI